MIFIEDDRTESTGRDTFIACITSAKLDEDGLAWIELHDGACLTNLACFTRVTSLTHFPVNFRSLPSEILQPASQ